MTRLLSRTTTNTFLIFGIVDLLIGLVLQAILPMAGIGWVSFLVGIVFLAF